MSSQAPTSSSSIQNFQHEAVRNARLAFSNLPNGNVLFRSCLASKNPIEETVNTLKAKYAVHKGKRHSKLLDAFQRYTAWLRNFSSVVDVVVQTEAGVGCPVWAPIKFVLQISDCHADVAEQIENMIQLMFDNLPRLEIYQSLNDEPVLKTALLNIFSDVVDFCVRILRDLGRPKLVRLSKLIATSKKKKYDAILQKLERHAREADQAAIATELRRAALFREEQIKKGRQDLKQKCETWLRASSMREVHRYQIQRKIPGTCDWIWPNKIFQDWNTMPSTATAVDRLLCISGTHGCGKSVLASSIVDSLRSQNKRVFFFSFSGTDPNRQTLDSLARAFLWQAFQESPDDCLDKIGKLMSGDQPITSELFKVLTEVWEAHSNSAMIWIIDGIDEYNQSNQDVFDQVSGLLDMHRDARAIVLGRPHILAHMTDKASTIEINAELNKPDVDTCIAAEVDKLSMVHSSEVRVLACSILQEKAGGMFLWVKLMSDDLHKASSQVELMERLNNLPRGLQEAYRHMLFQLVNGLDDIELKLAKRILGFVFAARRPLTIEELQYALALDARSTSKSQDKPTLQAYFFSNPAQKFHSVCGSLLHIADGKVSIVHFSAQEFLSGIGNSAIELDSRIKRLLSINLEEVHHSFGAACLGYLEIGQYGFPLQLCEGVSELVEQHTFLDYASRFITHHFNLSGQPQGSDSTRLQKFLDSEACIFWFEYLTVIIVEDLHLGFHIRELGSFLDRFDQAGFGSTLMYSAVSRMYQELASRKQRYGEQDWRTDQWRAILTYVTNAYTDAFDGLDLAIPTMEDESSLSIQEISEGTNSERGRTTQPTTTTSATVPRDFEPRFSEIIRSVRRDASLPLEKQIGVFIRLQYYLQKLQTLTDPLELLFRAILAKSHALPFFALLIIANFYGRVGRNEKALEVLHTALRKIGDQETLPKYEVYHMISRTYYRLRRYEESAEAARQAIAGRKCLLGPDHENTLMSEVWLAIALYYGDKVSEAEPLFQHVVQTRQRTLGCGDKLTLNALVWLSDILMELAKFAEMEALYRRTPNDWKEASGGNSENEKCKFMTSFAYALHIQGKQDEAEEVCRSIVEGHFPDGDDIDVLDANGKLHLNNFGVALLVQGSYEEAEKVFRRIVEAYPPDGSIKKKIIDDVGKVYLRSLASALSWQGKNLEADELYALI